MIKLDFNWSENPCLYLMLMHVGLYPKDKSQKYKKTGLIFKYAQTLKSKLICGINMVQYPTDHFQIPELLDQVIQKSSNDTIVLSAQIQIICNNF